MCIYELLQLVAYWVGGGLVFGLLFRGWGGVRVGGGGRHLILHVFNKLLI